MVCRSYSAREMLRLRHAPLQEEVSYVLAAKVEADPDLSEIIRTGSPRPLSLIVEESSAESIEEERRCRRAAAQQLDGTDSERKFRSQTDSEQGRAPLTAPPDLAAQKAEGFQKFFNSVVSPTHVRVTAGGRIVPNTRGPHSPTSKWTRERSPVDGMRQPRVVNGVHPEPIPFPVIPPGWTPFQPLFPGQAPGPVPAGMAFRPDQIPFFPAPIGFAGVPYNQISLPNHVPQPNMSATFGKQNEIHALHQPKPIQLSPAEHFDASRPFFYNNQWMIAYGNHPQPIGLMPPFPINTAPIPAQSQPAPTQPRSARKQSQQAPRPKGDANPKTAGREQDKGPARYGVDKRVWKYLPSVTSVHSSTVLPLSPRSPSPPKSSILASDITKSHLKILRAKKRQVEDQLQYNIHQIDRKGMESSLKEICDELNRFTFLHEKQLQGEAGTLPLFQTPIDLPAYYSQADAGSNSPAAARPGTQGETDDRPTPSHSPGSKGGATITSVENPELDGQAPQRKSSSLPVNAALAPPFQPRAETSNSSLATAGPDEPALVTHLPQPSRGSTFKGYFHPFVDRNIFGIPYLVGQLPDHIEVEDAKDTDRRYIRELNEHELHAIHMYRQRVPIDQQTGVVFDGVNFYYPRHDLGTASSQSSPENPQDSQPPASTYENDSLNDPFNAMAQAGTGAIRNRLDEATRSESLHRAEDSLRGSSTSELPRSESYVSQPSPRYLEFRRRVNEKTRISSENLRTKPSEDSGDEDGNLLFKGRRVMERSASTKHSNEIWSSMRRRGKTSANAVAGQVSPMTAQGVLPHYSGHATASLTPAIANTTSNSRGAGAKLGDTYTIPSTNTAAEKRGENKPPTNLLGQQLRSVSLHDKKHIGLPTR
ncbi:Hypothetical protein NCS54_00656600 [Fusarium falciforme]|uniref:Hypothetical protein n=1 Tax=Fusarium falciforme TaxID=195108 RepID=UPI002301BDA1|nr:Hypothetical protein NCS54_00656600 [Fusarium falciforme]WAO89183.1 Hypothetical protein NCS54_00656600 [Fusarium falciforme]